MITPFLYHTKRYKGVTKLKKYFFRRTHKAIFLYCTTSIEKNKYKSPCFANNRITVEFFAGFTPAAKAEQTKNGGSKPPPYKRI